MLYIFPLLILSLVTLLFYYNDKEKLNIKIDDLVSELQNEIEIKENLESKYNKVLSDLKREDELKKIKNIDEMQLLFTKVNLLDDKLTYFNTNFKSKLEQIFDIVNKNNFDKEIGIKENNINENSENSDTDKENLSKTESELKEISGFCNIENKTCDVKNDSFTRIDNKLDNQELDPVGVLDTLNEIANNNGNLVNSLQEEAKEESGEEVEEETSLPELSENKIFDEKLEDNEENLDLSSDYKSEQDINENSELTDKTKETSKPVENSNIKNFSYKEISDEDEGSLQRSLLDVDFLEGDSMVNNDVCSLDNSGNIIDIKDNEVISALNELDNIDKENIGGAEEDEKNNITPTTTLSENNFEEENKTEQMLDSDLDDEHSKISLDDGSFSIKDSIEKLKAQLDEDKK